MEFHNTAPLSLGVVVFAAVVSGVVVSHAQEKTPDAPPMPYEDVGACPFECCVYREWTANAAVTVLRERRPGSAVAFTVKMGDRVRAITGVVITLAPGRVQFRDAVDLQMPYSRTLHVEPGQVLYLLTYLGEGATKAWFQGRLYDEVYGMEFFDSRCTDRPGTCNGTILEKPRSEWWVRVRNMRGGTGWTNEPQKFDNKDACGD